MAVTITRKTATQNYRKTTLPNGLRIVTERIPSVRSVSLGVWFDVGSRNERPEENGMSHFIEHMLFKGTKRRTAMQIAESLEDVGGHLNAFTSREQTCYNVRVLDEFLGLAVDVLADITCNSTFTPVNIKREKQVILEEIKEAWDTPSDRIHDEFASVYWGGHPLGQPILGSAENVSGFSRAKVLDYMRRHYRAGSVVISAAGNIDHARLVDMVRAKFRFAPGRAQTAEEGVRPKAAPFRFIRGDGSQTHLCLGFPSVAYDSPVKTPVLALNSYLGGSMSSVIFQKIRETKGLAYSVYTFADFYRDTGVFGAYIGTDKAHVAGALEIILKEMERMKRRKIDSIKLGTIKAQLKGQIMLGMESTSSRMNRLGRHELYLERFQPFSETLSLIDQMTQSQIIEFANEAFDRSKLTVVTLGRVPRPEMRQVIRG